MPIQFTCPRCGKSTTVADQFAGQTGPCASCGNMITIPVSGGAFAAPPQKGSSSKVVIIVVLAVACFGLLLCGGVLAAILLPAVERARGAGQRASCRNNLKQIGLAMHNYHDTYGNFPPAFTTDANGKPLHSWRTLLLPYLEQDHIYRQLDLNEPWDSPKNQQIFALADTKVFGCPSDPTNSDKKFTNYMAVVGKETVFEDKPKKGGKGVAIKDIIDGTSNTVMFVEVEGQNVPWMKPQDITLDQFVKAEPGKPGPGSKHPRIYQAVLADGSVRAFSNQLPSETRRAMVTKSGGEQVNLFDD